MNNETQPNPRISGLSSLKKQQLKSNTLSSNQQQDFLQHIRLIEQDILPQLDRLIKLQGYTSHRNAQLELLGLIDGIANFKATKEHWTSYAYQKGYITGTNRFWSKKFGYLTKEEEGL